jgi:serine/threonine protein phosphatase PrpC
LILACDGVWDVISDQQAVDICLRPDINGQELSADMMACKLRDMAYLYGSTDNISVVVVKITTGKRRGEEVEPDWDSSEVE